MLQETPSEVDQRAEKHLYKDKTHPERSPDQILK